MWKTCEFIKPLVCHFGKIDDEIRPILDKMFKFPDFKPAPSFTEGFLDMSLSATNYLESGLIFKKTQDGLKHFISVTPMHRLMKKHLDTTLTLVQRSKNTTDEVKFEPM